MARELTKKYEEHIGNNITSVIDFFQEKEVRGEITIVIRGIKKTNSSINKSNLKKELDELMDAGLSLSEASKYLAKKNGLNKSVVYNLN